MDSAITGGHYFSTETGVDPWNGIKYQSDARGVAIISAEMSGFSLDDTMPVMGRTGACGGRCS